MRALEDFLGNILNENLGKLILRISLGFLMLFHGYKKYVYGIDGIKGLLVKSGFPDFIAYGVYFGELIIPVLIIIGLYTRISSFIYAFTMVFAIYLVHSSHLFSLNERTGGLIIENPLLYMLAAVVLMFIGAGKFSIDKK